MLTTWCVFQRVYCISKTSQSGAIVYVPVCGKDYRIAGIGLAILTRPCILLTYADLNLLKKSGVVCSPGAYESVSEWASEWAALLLFPLLLINQQASGSEAVNNILKGMLNSIAIATGTALWSLPAVLALLTPSIIRHSGQSPRGSLFNSFQADRQPTLNSGKQAPHWCTMGAFHSWGLSVATMYTTPWVCSMPLMGEKGALLIKVQMHKWLLGLHFTHSALLSCKYLCKYRALLCCGNSAL